MFGPIIGLLAFFNLVATLVLFVAAWISTADGGPGKTDKIRAWKREVPEPAVVVHEGLEAETCRACSASAPFWVSGGPDGVAEPPPELNTAPGAMSPVTIAG